MSQLGKAAGRAARYRLDIGVDGYPTDPNHPFNRADGSKYTAEVKPLLGSSLERPRGAKRYRLDAPRGYANGSQMDQSFARKAQQEPESEMEKTETAAAAEALA